MRRLLASIGLVLALAAPRLAFAQDLWTMEGFRSDITVKPDGVVEVRETIDADFTTSRHGIYRYVPYRGTNDHGGKYLVDIALASVTRDGQDEPYQESRAGDDVSWKIGRADKTWDGKHEYVITYDVRGAIGSFDAYDEIYWNATGDGWDVPLPIATASVTLPKGVVAMQSACYTGPEGSTAKDCRSDAMGERVTFIASRVGDPMTVAVGFPKGSVPIIAASQVNVVWYLIWHVMLPVLLPLVTLIILYRRWRRSGADEKFQTIVAQYESPDGLRPAELRGLLGQGSGSLDVAATVIDLAVRGFVKIEEVQRPLFGKDYVIHLLKDPDDPEARPFERILLKALFGDAPFAVSEVSLSSLRSRDISGKVSASAKEVSVSLVERGYLDAAADKAMKRFMGIGIAFAVGSFLLGAIIAAFGFGWPVSLFAVGVLFILFGRFMAKWTDKGHEAAWRAKGYQEFISKVEKYRAPWMETQQVFESVLPYALAFGLGKKWAAAFRDVGIVQPSWYVGAHPGVWSATSFNQSLQGFSGTFATRSGTSGSGGGGSSGGGGGGGGGGSW